MCVRCFSTFSEKSLFLKRRWCRTIWKWITAQVRTPRRESLYFKFDVIFQALSIPPFDESWNGLCFDVFRCFRLCLKSLLFFKGAGITQFKKWSHLKSELHAKRSRYTLNSTSLFKLYRFSQLKQLETVDFSQKLGNAPKSIGNWTRKRRKKKD